MSSPSPIRCSEHPDHPAAWGCLGCARALCPDCAELLEVGQGVEVVGCRTCGGNAPPLRVSGSEEPFTESLRGLLRMPVSAAGFAGLWLLAVLGARVARPAGPWGLLAWSAPMWAVAIALFRATAERGGTLGASVRLPVTSDLLLPAARGLLLTAPLVLWSQSLGPSWGTGLVVAAGLCAPTLLARLGSGRGLAAVVDPRWHLRAWHAATRDTTVAAAASIALLLFSRALWTSAELGEGEVPPLWREVAGTVAAFGLFLVPQLAGLLVRAHADALGFPLEDRGQRLAWPGAVPRHRRTLHPESVAPAPARARAALEVDGSGASEPLVLEPLAGGRDREPTG